MSSLQCLFGGCVQGTSGVIITEHDSQDKVGIIAIIIITAEGHHWLVNPTSQAWVLKILNCQGEYSSVVRYVVIVYHHNYGVYRIDEQMTEFGTHQSHNVTADYEDITAVWVWWSNTSHVLPACWLLTVLPVVRVGWMYRTEQTEVAKCTTTSTHQSIGLVLYVWQVFITMCCHVLGASWWRWPNVLLMVHINQQSKHCTCIQVSVCITWWCIRSELMTMTECAAYGTHQPREWVLSVSIVQFFVRSELMKMDKCAAYVIQQSQMTSKYKDTSAKCDLIIM